MEKGAKHRSLDDLTSVKIARYSLPSDTIPEWECPHCGRYHAVSTKVCHCGKSMLAYAWKIDRS